MKKLIFASVFALALTADASERRPLPPTKPCVGENCPDRQHPREREYDSGKKQCGWKIVDGKRVPLFECPK